MAQDPVQEDSSFLKLPPEIRNHIYNLSNCLILSQVAKCSSRTIEVTNEDDSDTVSRTKCAVWYCPVHYNNAATSFSLWVNRNGQLKTLNTNNPPSNRVKILARVLAHLTRVRGFRSNAVACQVFGQAYAASTHGDFIERITQPALTRIYKEIREETLPMFYGKQPFLFTLFTKEIDTISICKWLKTIGKVNASFLRTIKIVYRKKKDCLYIQHELLPIMHKLGVRTEAKEGVVMAIRLTYPFCYCEGCIRKLLGEG